MLALWLLLQESTLDSRSYRLHVPKNAKTPAPLVLALHGMGSSGRQMEGLTGFNALADRHGFAVAYPDGLNRKWNYWDDDKDLAFLVALIDDLVAKGTADRTRVYVTGISNGAYMAQRLAADRADRIAAFAAVAGTMSTRMAEIAKPSRPVPHLYFHGTEDAIAGYDGKDRLTKRKLSLSAEEAVVWWAKKNGCQDAPLAEKLPDKEDDGTTVERRTYGGEAPVVFYRIDGGGHTWPGMPGAGGRVLGRTCRDFGASEVMWEFFARHSRK